MTRSVRGMVAMAVLLGAWPAAASAQPAAPAQPTVPAVPAVLQVPDGFAVTVFASDLPRARLMAASPEGVLVVAKRNEVVALPDADGDGKAEPRVLFGDLWYAHSVAFGHGYSTSRRRRPSAGEVDRGGQGGRAERIVELPTSTPSLHTSRSLASVPTAASTCQSARRATPASRATRAARHAGVRRRRPERPHVRQRLAQRHRLRLGSADGPSVGRRARRRRTGR